MALDLDDYRREADTFLTALEDAERRHHAGLTPELPLARIHERHEDLFRPGAVRALLAGGPPALARFAAEGHLDAAAREADERAAAEEAATRVVAGDTRLPLRAVPGALANEPDADRRARLETAAVRAADDRLTPLRHEAWSRRHAAARALGAESYRALVESVWPVDLDGLAAHAQRMTRQTDELYERAMDRALRDEAGLTLGEATRADLPRLWRGAAFDDRFPPGGMLAALDATLTGLGIDPRRQSAIHVDAAVRPTKSPRAFCSPVRVPDEVHLVILPAGGVDDYHALMHEAGHAQHFAGTARHLPVEARRMGDDTLTETWAFLFQSLLHDPVWLAAVMGVRDDGATARRAVLHRLFLQRRYAAKLAYELVLHAPGGLDAGPARYEDLLSDAVRMPWPGALWLTDLDAGLYGAAYLRAWALEVTVRGHLRDRFGTRWFAQRAAGGLLRELWETGTQLTGDDLAAELGLPAIDVMVLATEAEEALSGA